ncbi:STAS domain-containing protein [Streptomyces sp. NPDC059785]|uniref:STAS domain-containing protein n=1 Tax=unclassified Streptomyces TaxID=2593676 RepID=UPI00365D7CC2
MPRKDMFLFTEPADARLLVRDLTSVDGDTERTVALIGELDVRTVGILSDTVVTRIKAGRPYVRLDLSGVSWCDNASLYMILGVRRALHTTGGHLDLTSISLSVERAIVRNGLSRLLHPQVASPCCCGAAAASAPAAG